MGLGTPKVWMQSEKQLYFVVLGPMAPLFWHCHWPKFGPTHRRFIPWTQSTDVAEPDVKDEAHKNNTTGSHLLTDPLHITCRWPPHEHYVTTPGGTCTMQTFVLSITILPGIPPMYLETWMRWSRFLWFGRQGERTWNHSGAFVATIFEMKSCHTAAILVLNLKFVEAYGRFVEEAFPEKPLIITEAGWLFVSNRCLDTVG